MDYQDMGNTLGVSGILFIILGFDVLHRLCAFLSPSSESHLSRSLSIMHFIKYVFTNFCFLQAAVLRHYEGTLAACDALDYHDFITFAVRLLEKNPEGTSSSDTIMISSQCPAICLSSCLKILPR